MIGILGAHRSGKSTLAKTVAETLGLPFVQTRTSQVFARMGIDPAAPMSFATRLQIQDEVLNDAESIWSEHATFVTDRTPLDMIAYTVCDVQGDTLSAEDEQALRDYDRRCMTLTERHFDVLTLVQPGIPIVPEPGKASLSPGYIEHFNLVAGGLMLRDMAVQVRQYLPRECLDLAQRVDCVTGSYRRLIHQRTVELVTERIGKALH